MVVVTVGIDHDTGEILYGPASPYGWTKTYATLGAIRREDLVAWHGRMFHPD
mgnify:CR=1 FL=1